MKKKIKKSLTPEQKKILSKYFILTLIGVVFIVLSAIFANEIYGENSIFAQPVTQNQFINTLYSKIPIVIRSIIIIIIVLVLSKLLRKLIHKTISSGNRKLTAAKLIDSFLKYFVAVLIILILLSTWGVDTGTLVASAGILSLIIGLGAQSLVSDIIAGLFIVFEEEYAIGDIVIIDGWRGTVQEIGIRTTKIVDAGGNTKIINNSNITEVINMTGDLSLAVCDVSIEYGESLERVEKVIKENLNQIKKNIPSVKEGPFYKGVSQLADSGVILKIVAKCSEEDKFQTQRDLNREIKLIFDKNNINIPFPQVVVNSPSKSSKVKNADKSSASKKENISKTKPPKKNK